MIAAPGYWMHEMSGVLRPAVETYLAGGAMTPEHIAAMRAYCRQWAAADWRDESDGRDIAALREAVDGLTTREAIEAWFRRAADLAIDPL